MKTISTKESFLEDFEKEILSRIDNFAESYVNMRGAGWKDRDLPDLLPAIKKHGEVLYKRIYGGGE